jgi:AAA15 family ATPase/GTPase
MILKALKYSSSWLGNWSIVSGTTNDEFVAFSNINLIVGRNASGKTKFIGALRWISDLFDEGARVGVLRNKGNSFEVIFQNSTELKYCVEFDNSDSVVEEILVVNDEIKLDRKKRKLHYEKLGDSLEFQIDSHLLASSRRDNIQQPFFEVLHNWGRNLSHYPFGGNMGKGRSERIDDFDSLDIVHFKNINLVRTFYHRGINEFATQFEQTILNDMNRIDYYISNIKLDIESKWLQLSVKEKDLNTPTNLEDMSQGMARAFSLIVQLNYSLMAKIPSCILIDDIGEGLDYDRSKKLIELIIEKAEGSNIQVFMTTNDRFVMNSVPLKYWSVIHREGNKSVFYNYQNSKQTFDDFAFTGLNNFDFFATEFYRQGFEEFIATAQ